MVLDIVNPAVEQYLEGLLRSREPWFVEMEELANREAFPAIGPMVGIMLEILARAINAKRILELGSGYGYSGLWFARALQEDGYLLLSDFAAEHKTMAEKYFTMARKKHLMEFRVGDALALLKEQTGPFDIVFNDVDKELYPKVIEPVYKILRIGGLFITDNTLWFGKVAAATDPCDRATAAVKDFNRKLNAHPGFLTTWLPMCDGVSISIKIN